ncbi:MAG: four helix bundle protein [Rubrobacteraceae bacterium]
MRDFRELKVWHKGHRLTLEVYKATAGFPREERYGLTSQIRRSASSIPANMAEGCGRSGDAELARFMLIAMGSASELEYHLLLAYDLGFLEEESHKELSEKTKEIKRMLSKFINKLQETTQPKKLTG